MDEILNIDYHVKTMVLKAVNKYPTLELAAKALGVSDRCLYRYRKTYGIGRNKITGVYYLKPQKNIVLQHQIN